MRTKRLPVEIISIDNGFAAVTPGTQTELEAYSQLTYGRNAAARDDFQDDPDESIKTFQNPEAEPKSKKPDKTVHLRGFATIDERIAEAIQSRKAHKTSRNQ